MNTSSDRNTLIVELGTEELPPKALNALSVAFAQGIVDGLANAKLLHDESEHSLFASPRRLAVKITNVSATQADQIQARRGPALAAAYDSEGQPTKALLGFAKSCGVSPDVLETEKSEKGEWLVFQQMIKGQSLPDILNLCLAETVKKLPIPKKMRWGSGQAEFVRPVHWLLAVHGMELLPVEVLDISSDQFTFGHRHHVNKPIRIDNADDYESILSDQGKVIADWQLRRKLIRDQVSNISSESDFIPVIEEGLLDLVTGLVEWPTAIVGNFDERFLALPPDVLVSSMQDHQKYFHGVDSDGVLQPYFITVSNIESPDMDRIRSGNERVLRARLADAEFFWTSDLKLGLDHFSHRLDGLLFHKKLGSVQHKVSRIKDLGMWIGEMISADSDDIERAAKLCKADLVSDMVGEFPELQGVVGHQYALKQSESPVVAKAIEQHYLPRFAGDTLPDSEVSQAIALADRIDSIVGIFAAGESPTGDKDPYGLRRAALGVIRILIENELDLSLRDMIRHSLKQFESIDSDKLTLDSTTEERVYEYIYERLPGYYSGQYSADEVAAVMACQPSSPLDFSRRIAALSAFCTEESDAAAALAAANKRIANILSKAPGSLPEFSESQILEDDEKKLFENLLEVEGKALSLGQDKQYADALKVLASTRTVIDQFFDNVMVMHEDEKIKLNRFALLSRFRSMFIQIADISKIRSNS